MANTNKYESHFKTEIIVNESIENFNKDNLKVEFVEINLKDDNGNKVCIAERPYTILYDNSENQNQIKFNLYILNNNNRKSERIDYLLDDGYEISDIILDIYYEDIIIDNYTHNELIGEQVDLIDILNNYKTFKISKKSFITISQVSLECSFLLIPRNDEDKLVLNRKVVYNDEDTQGVKYFNNGTVINFDGYTILDKFKKVDIYLISKGVPIVPKDLENLSINIDNNITIGFQNKGDKWFTIHSVSNIGTINRIYCTPCFNIFNVNCIKIGYIYKNNNEILINTDVSLYKNKFLI